MKPVDVNSNPYIHLGEKKLKKILIKVGDHLIISEYKNIFRKGYVPNLSE